MKIGIFDSGVGGISILMEVKRNLPSHDYVYIGDQKNIPYGDKDKDEIFLLSCRIVDFLIEKGCRFIIIACNTITVAASSRLRDKYKDIVFVGIEPAIKFASENSKTKNIGLLATKYTLESENLKRLKDQFAKDINVYTSVGNGLVELVENNTKDEIEIKKILSICLFPFLNKDIDQLVLGCTHYPFLANEIKDILGEKINIVNPSEAIARRVEYLLVENKFTELGNSSLLFFTTGNLDNMKNFTKRFFENPNISYIEI